MSTVCDAPPLADDLVVAVRTLDKAFEHWVRDSKDDDFPPVLVKAVGVVCTLVTTGFPQDDRLVGLFMSCCTLASAYQDVLQESPGSARRLVECIESVVKFLDSVEQHEEIPVQSVASMLKDYGQASQRYIWVAKAYGEYDIESDIWRGPFFSRTGIANQSLIDKEASAPGSVLGENYQPQSHKVKTARIKAAAMKQLASLQAGLFRPEGGKVPEKASVLDLLQDGQFPDVIARVKGVTVAEVIRVATENGVKVEYRDSVLDRASLEASSDPMAEARGYQKPRFDEAEDFDVYDDDPGDVPVDPAEPDELDPMDIDTAPQVTEKMTSEELTEFALQMLSDDDEVTAHDILAAAVTATGKTASRQMLTPILRSLKGGA
jgi:hypothetical protein